MKALLAAALLLSVSASAAPHWIDAHQSSPADFDFVIPENVVLPPERREILRDRPPVIGTLRMRFTIAASGRQVRVRLSNETGTEPLVIAAASIGMAATGFDARPASLRPLTFGTRTGITIPAGAPALSDPIDLPVAALDDLIVSIDLPAGLKLKAFGSAIMAFAPGNQTLAPSLASADTIIGRPPLSAALVLADPAPGVIVALGDSITDGNRPKLGTLRGWPDQLLRRLVAGQRRPPAVVNAGIGGNRVISSGWGQAAVARLDRDVLRVAGVTHLIVLEGINDIGNGGSSPLNGDKPPLDIEDVIAGYRQILARAHTAGIRVSFGTLTPFAGSTGHTRHREAQRQRLNQWIRTSGEPDSVIDFDAAVRDPADPARLLPAYDSGDHIHPGDAGYRAMGDAIDLGLFTK